MNAGAAFRLSGEAYQSVWAGVSGSWTSLVAIVWEAPVWWEHCAVLMPYPMGQPGRWAGSEFGLTTGIYGRTADAVVKLKTGGKGKSKLRNLFCLTGVAAEVADKMSYSDGYEDTYGNYDIYGPTGTLPIPPQNVTIMGQALDINSNVYKILPDNADIDVTPRVPGEDFYAFNVQQQKYHSYFDLFVQQANPGYSLNFSNPTNDVGHAFWQLRTDAPSDALQYISSSLTVFLGHRWGFYPTNDTLAGLFDLPGFLQNDDSHSYNETSAKLF